MQKQRGIAIKALVIIGILLVLVYAIESNLKGYEKLDNTNVEALIKASLEVQYNQAEYTLSDIYTDGFVSTLSNTEFYKNKWAPYKIMTDGIVQIDENKDKTLLIFSVHIEDRAGSYFQTITIKKMDRSYRIYLIEYDI
ncbi:hypothetical protein [Fusibacter ferrireducens]|uniref:DUF4878 domain-containing protein n=1 Tax=Fusibacter ferrireducens TaxID=2785058 RepID=A0ABR9ZZU1_9FIRM|nr:hypothetical protein [Fusibacter ferrireducens]MBF4695972.1 hypothetical protein [Fusibacter ferrireducens]